MTKENKKINKPKHLIFFGVILVAVITIIIGAIWYVGFRSPAKTEEAFEEVITPSNKSDTSDWLTYENEEYGFSFKYPKSWGNVVESVEERPEGSKIIKSFRLSSRVDADYYINIQIVKVKDKNEPSVLDYPHTFITENKRYAFYFSGGGDCAGLPGCERDKFFIIKKEINKIIDTFVNKI